MRKVLITGGTRGIGFACCEKFFREGAEVVATWSHSEEDANEAKRLLPGVKFVRVDVSREEEVKNLLESLKELDVLVNNAGIHLFRQVQDTSWEEWRKIIDTNAGGAFLTTKYAAKKLMERQGSIINVGSVWGEIGGSCESAYSASKGAMMAFTKAIAKELAPMKVTVNCVSPGAIDTKMNQNLTKEEIEELIGEIPLERLGKSEEIAEVVYFLSLQRYLTGQIVTIDGGWSIS